MKRPHAPQPCPTCRGRGHTGEMEDHRHANGYTYQRLKPCPACNGTRREAPRPSTPATDYRARAAGERNE